MALMETLYLSHGAPTLAIDETAPTRQFFKSWQQSVYKEKPSSILVISAHWETEPTVNVVDRNDTRLLWLPQALVPGTLDDHFFLSFKVFCFLILWTVLLSGVI
jgi:hypothetical protein